MDAFQQAQMILLADLVIRHEGVDEIAHEVPMCQVCRVPAPCGIWVRAKNLLDTTN